MIVRFRSLAVAASVALVLATTSAIAGCPAVAITAGLLPILWTTGTGSEVMQRIAVPMIGSMISSTILTLIVIPAIYALVKGYGLRNRGKPRAHDLCTTQSLEASRRISSAGSLSLTRSTGNRFAVDPFVRWPAAPVELDQGRQVRRAEASRR